jgi:hypothetical protein
MALARAGYGVDMDRAELRARNWPALAALWTIGSVWLAVGALIFAAGVFDFDPPEALGWALLAVAMAGFTLALIGVSWMRDRGETALALAALVLAVMLPTGSWFFAFSLFGGLGVD